MPAIQLIVGQCASFTLSSKGSDGALRPSIAVLRTSNYAVGCVNIDSGKQVAIRAKTVGTFDVNITGHSQDNTEMTPITFNVNVSAVPVPQADHFETSAVFIDDGYLKPGDPGTDTVTFNF